MSSRPFAKHRGGGGGSGPQARNVLNIDSGRDPLYASPTLYNVHVYKYIYRVLTLVYGISVYIRLYYTPYTAIIYYLYILRIAIDYFL